jgi:hypothetical protein
MDAWREYREMAVLVDHGRNWAGHEDDFAVTAQRLAKACRSEPEVMLEPSSEVKLHVFGMCLPSMGFPVLHKRMTKLVNASNCAVAAREVEGDLPGRILEAGVCRGWPDAKFLGEQAFGALYGIYVEMPTFFLFHEKAALGHVFFFVAMGELARVGENLGKKCIELLSHILSDCLPLPGPQATLPQILLNVATYENRWTPSLMILLRVATASIEEIRSLRAFAIDFFSLLRESQWREGYRANCRLLAGQLACAVRLEVPAGMNEEKHWARLLDERVEISPYHLLCRSLSHECSSERASFFAYQLIAVVGEEYDFHNPNGSIPAKVKRPGLTISICPKLREHRDVYGPLWERLCENFLGTSINPIQLAFGAGNSFGKRLSKNGRTHFLAQLVMCFMCAPSGKVLSFLLQADSTMTGSAKKSILAHVYAEGYGVRVHVKMLLAYIEEAIAEMRARENHEDFKEEIAQFERFKFEVNRQKVWWPVGYGSLHNIIDMIQRILHCLTKSATTFQALSAIKEAPGPSVVAEVVGEIAGAAEKVIKPLAKTVLVTAVRTVAEKAMGNF